MSTRYVVDRAHVCRVRVGGWENFEPFLLPKMLLIWCVHSACDPIFGQRPTINSLYVQVWLRTYMCSTTKSQLHLTWLEVWWSLGSYQSMFHHAMRRDTLSHSIETIYDLWWSFGLTHHVPRRCEPLITPHLSLWGNARTRATFPTHKKSHNPHPQGGGGEGGQDGYITLGGGGGGACQTWIIYIYTCLYIYIRIHRCAHVYILSWGATTLAAQLGGNLNTLVVANLSWKECATTPAPKESSGLPANSQTIWTKRKEIG